MRSGFLINCRFIVTISNFYYPFTKSSLILTAFNLHATGLGVMGVVLEMHWTGEDEG